MFKGKKQRLIGAFMAVLFLAPSLAMTAQAKERPLLNFIKTKLEERQTAGNGGASSGEQTSRGLEGLLNVTIAKLELLESRVVTTKASVKAKIQEWKNRNAQ